MIRRIVLSCALAAFACIASIAAPVGLAYAGGPTQVFSEDAPAYVLKHPASMSDFFQLPPLIQLVVAVVIAVTFMVLIGNFITTRNHARQHAAGKPLNTFRLLFYPMSPPTLSPGVWRG